MVSRDRRTIQIIYLDVDTDEECACAQITLKNTAYRYILPDVEAPVVLPLQAQTSKSRLTSGPSLLTTLTPPS